MAQCSYLVIFETGPTDVDPSVHLPRTSDILEAFKEYLDLPDEVVAVQVKPVPVYGNNPAMQ